MDIVRDVQFLFGFKLLNELLSNCVKTFDVKYATCGGSFVNYGT